MAITSTYVHDLPLVNDPSQFEIPGFSIETNAGAKALMSSLKGDTGASPNISITFHTLPYGSQPTVDKGGTETAPIFDIGFPLAQNGQTPEFQYANGYIQYRYGTGEWQNLVPVDTLIQPALDAATEATNAANSANTAAGNANNAATAANIAATDAISAASNANTAADSANTAATNAETATIDAENAAQAANTAAQNAQEAADNVQDGKTPQLQVGTVTDLVPGSTPTVQVIQTGIDPSGNPVYTINFGLVEGQQGLQGEYPELVNGTIQTGAPGSSVSLTFTYSGDTELGQPIYRIDGSIPQGTPGSGNGNVQVDATGLVQGNQYVFVPNTDNSAIGTFQPYTGVSDWNDIQNKPTFATVATSGSYVDLSNTPNLTPEFVTSNAYNATETSVSETVQLRSIQNGVGQPVTVQLPVATTTNAGVMPAPMYAQIQTNTQDIINLKAQGGRDWGSFATKADLDAFGIPDGAAVRDEAKVRNDETQGGASTLYVIRDIGGTLTWTFDLIINYLPPTTATTTNLGLVKGSTIDGQQFVEVDGTMSTIGWSALKQRITNTETDLLGKQNTLVAGENITIDNTNPNSPVISATNGSSSIFISSYTPQEILYEDDNITIQNRGQYNGNGTIRFTCKNGTFNGEYHYMLYRPTANPNTSSNQPTIVNQQYVDITNSQGYAIGGFMFYNDSFRISGSMQIGIKCSTVQMKYE